MNKVFVGNLAFSCTQEDVSRHFQSFGATVQEVQIVTDRETGKARGFGFVTLSEDTDTRQIIQQANGTTLNGRQLTVNEAKPKTPRGDSNASYGRDRRERY